MSPDLSTLWDPFLTITLSGQNVAIPSLKMALADPKSQWRAQMLGARRDAGAYRSLRSCKHKAVSWRVNPAGENYLGWN